jgi:hypothetical protein
MNKRIAVLGATLFTVFAVGSTGLMAHSVDTEKYLTTTGVELYEIIDGRETLIDRHDLSDASAIAPKATKKISWPIGKKKEEPKPAPSPTPQIPGKLGTIITIGEKIWAIIEKNRPVVTGTYASISALPAGVKSWTELQGWSEPTIRLYKLVYTNVYKMKVVEFEYRVAYTTGGNLKGKGQYLSRVEVEPKLLNVLWGYKFDANGAVLNVTNVGTSEEPMAAMELNLNWTIGTVMKHHGESVRYYIRGDGLFKSLSDGSIQNGLN